MLWACAACTARYAPGTPACPQCGSTEYRDAPGGAVEDGAPLLNSAAAEPAAPSKVKAKPADSGTTETAP